MSIKLFLKKLLKKSLLLQKVNYWRIYNKFYIKQNPYLNIKPKKLCKNGIIYVLAPSYSNLGDVAIFVKSIDYLQEKLGLPIKAILYSHQCVKKENILSLDFYDSDVVVMHGGGNMGNIYFCEELLRQNIVKWFPKNTIISMPQSILFYEDNKNYILQRARKIYSKHKKFVMFSRDIPSLEFAKSNFMCSNLLCPDMVLSAMPNRKKEFNKNCKVLLCLRKDIESKMNINFQKDLERILLDSGYTFEYWDTDDLSGKNIENKSEKINEILNFLNTFQFVITDRYHGTILSYISKTPCIGLDNSYGKIKNGFIWFNNCNYMFYAESIYEIKNAIQKIENLSELKINEELYTKFILLEKSLIGEKNE